MSVTGKIVQVIGPVVDMRFRDRLPRLYNAIIIPFVLYFGYGITEMGSATTMASVLALMAFSVFAGEVISCYVFGPVLVLILNRINKSIKISD